MKYKVILISILMFLALINIVFATNSEIVGVWVDSYNNYDEYKADGTYVGFNIDNNKKYIGVTGKYKIESDKIIITFTAGVNLFIFASFITTPLLLKIVL